MSRIPLNETIWVKGIILEADRSKLPAGVLRRGSWPICNIGKRNQNNRIYSKSVWEKVQGQKSIQEKLANRTLFGQAEHPETVKSDLQLTSHIITGFKLDEAAGVLYQNMDILDTPCGRIINTLLEAGCLVGVSTRAEGDLVERKDDEGTYFEVLAESYDYVTTDFTADPSTFNTKPLNLERSIHSIEKELCNEKLTDSEKRFAISLLESLEKKEGEDEVKKLKDEEKKRTGESETMDELVKSGALPEGLTLGSQVTLKNGKYKGKTGSVTKLSESTMTLSMEDGTAVVVSDYSTINIASGTNTSPTPTAPEAMPEETPIVPNEIDQEIDDAMEEEPIEDETEEEDEDDDLEEALLRKNAKKITESYQKGDEVDYHGRTGTVVDIDGSYVIVFFEDTDEEEAIAIDELQEQNDYSDDLEEALLRKNRKRVIEAKQDKEPCKVSKKDRKDIETKMKSVLKTVKGKTAAVAKVMSKLAKSKQSTEYKAEVKKAYTKLTEGYAPKNVCPECGVDVFEDDDTEDYACPECGWTGVPDVVDDQAKQDEEYANQPFESKKSLTFESYNAMVEYLSKAYSKLSTKQKATICTTIGTGILRENDTSREGLKKYRNMRIKEAQLKAERDKAVELLESKQDRVSLSERYAERKNNIIAAELTEAKTQVERYKSGFYKALDEKKKMAEANVKKIEEEKSRTIRSFVKEYVETKLDVTNLKINENSRTLLENCSSLKEVDSIFDQIIESVKIGALLPRRIESIEASSLSTGEHRGPGDLVYGLMKKMKQS